jgi:cell shape-determining protein MreD
VAVRAGGFSALIVVGMTVMGVAVLFASFYVLLGVDTVNNMKMTECEFSSFLILNWVFKSLNAYVQDC